MDAIDQQILQLLHGNARLSQEQIARQVHLSRPAVHERLKRLEQRRIVRGYRAHLDWAALGKPLTAFIWVRTSSPSFRKVADRVVQAGGEAATVEECHRVTGDWCLLLKVRTTSPLALQNLVDRIREVPGVEGTMTNLALSTVTEYGAVEEG